MRFTNQAAVEYPVYDAGIYTAELKEYSDAGPGQYGKDRVRLDWALLDEDNQRTDDTLPSWVSQILTPKSTLYAVACALLGVAELAEEAQIDMDDLVGKRCQISVTVTARKDGLGNRNNITAYVPLRRKAARPIGGAPGRQPVAAGVAAGATEDPKETPF